MSEKQQCFYTVRSMFREAQNKRETSMDNAGYVVTVRTQLGRVVKQFPRIMSETGGHRIAQLFIKGMK